MRLLLIVIVVLGWVVDASAQSTLAPLPSLPPIGLPLPEITAPLTPIALPPATSGFEKPPVSQRSDGSRHGRRRLPRQPAVVYVFDSYYWSVPHGARSATPGYVSEPASTAAITASSPGRLQLDVDPPGAELQVFVDGSFVGTAEDLGDVVELTPGRHKIELRARGYEPLGFDANVTAGRTITYSGALERLVPPSDHLPTAVEQSPSEAPASPSTFYYIPGCYMGNVPPTDVVLPPNCDRSKLVTRTP